MPVYNTSQYKLVATPAAHPFHDQGKPGSNISRQHICVNTETIWTNQSLGSPTIAQVGISSAPSLSFSRATNTHANMIAQELEATIDQFQQPPTHEELVNKDPMYMTNYYPSTTEVFQLL